MTKFILKIALGIALMANYSCGGEHTTAPAEDSKQLAASTYKCPMACEGEKTYTEEGLCPVCNMKLEKVEGSNADTSVHSNHDAHSVDHEHDAH